MGLGGHQARASKQSGFLKLSPQPLLNLKPYFMNAQLIAKLARIQNRDTRYEVRATNGSQSVLVGYTPRKGRAGIHSIVTKHAEAITRFMDADSIYFERRAADGAKMGNWKINFSGRTQRDAYIGGELPFFLDLITETAVA